MTPLSSLARALYAEEVRRAREMAGGDKLLEGPRLFDRACRLMADGIRHRHPDLDADGVMALVRASLDRMRDLEHG